MRGRRLHGHRRGSGNLFRILFDSHRRRRLVIALVVEGIRAGADHSEMSANQVRVVLLQRTGVCFLLGHAQHGEQIENALRLYLELSRQLIDPDFAHS
jgi:hypothetical protein